MLLTWFPWVRRNLMPFKEVIATSSLRWKETHLHPWNLSRPMSWQRIEHHQRREGIQNVGVLRGSKGFIIHLFTQPLTQVRAALTNADQRQSMYKYLSSKLPDLLPSLLFCRTLIIKTMFYTYSTPWVRTDVGYGNPLRPDKELHLPSPPPAYTYEGPFRNIFLKHIRGSIDDKKA